MDPLSTTRSGAVFKPSEPVTMSSDEAQASEGQTTGETLGATNEDLIRSLMEDRRAMQAHMESLMRIVERSHSREESRSGGDAMLSSATTGRRNLSELKLTKLADNDDIEAYLTTFERLAGGFGIEKERWAYLLAPQLTGKAQQAFAALPTEVSGDYDEVKAAILRRYNITEEAYRQRFRGVARKEGGSYRELGVRAMDLLNRWMQKYSGDPKQVLEQIAIEQLLSTLPRDIQIWVRERKPVTVVAAGQLADDYVMSRGQIGGVTRREETRCQYCDKRGHVAKECRKAAADKTAADKSTTDKSVGGRQTEGLQPNPRAKRERGPLRCFNCQEIGHIAAKCPSKPSLYTDHKHRETVLQSPLEKPPDTERAAMAQQGEVEGVPVNDIVLDTGSARTLARSDLVPKTRKLGVRYLYGVHMVTLLFTP